MIQELPIALMSFDRPRYLEGVLQTLSRQSGFGSRQPRFFLFQDGAHDGTGTAPLADEGAIDQCVELFRAYMPDGEVHRARYNLGVAHNFDRAERLFFVERGYDCAVFLEDDMLLQPHYMDTLVALLDIALAHPHIGVVSAYGHHPQTPLEEQRRLATELCPMNEHNWAFGITRDCWLRRETIVGQYLDKLGDTPYRERRVHHGEINELLRRFGRGGQGYLSSQDSVKNMACEVLGIHRVSTFTNNACYIGRTGLHMTADRFFARGYHRTVLYPDAHTEFAVPDVSTLRAMRAAA